MEDVELFSDTNAVLRLVGSVLIEIDDEWQVERRYFSPELMQRRKQHESGPDAHAIGTRKVTKIKKELYPFNTPTRILTDLHH